MFSSISISLNRWPRTMCHLLHGVTRHSTKFAALYSLIDSLIDCVAMCGCQAGAHLRVMSCHLYNLRPSLSFRESPVTEHRGQPVPYATSDRGSPDEVLYCTIHQCQYPGGQEGRVCLEGELWGRFTQSSFHACITTSFHHTGRLNDAANYVSLIVELRAALAPLKTWRGDPYVITAATMAGWNMVTVFTLELPTLLPHTCVP